MSGPELPPRRWGACAGRLTEMARSRRFALPVCLSCGAVQYPPREICAECLSDSLEWRDVSASGTLLAATRLHHSNLPYFRAHAPIAIGSVRLDAGPRAVVFLMDGCCAAGTRVELELHLDAAREGILFARPAGAGVTEVPSVD